MHPSGMQQAHQSRAAPLVHARSGSAALFKAGHCEPELGPGATFRLALHSSQQILQAQPCQEKHGLSCQACPQGQERTAFDDESERKRELVAERNREQDDRMREAYNQLKYTERDKMEDMREQVRYCNRFHGPCRWVYGCSTALGCVQCEGMPRPRQGHGGCVA